MDRVYKERPFFFALFNAPDDYSLRRGLLKRMSPSQVKALSLVALNVLHGAIGVAEKKKKQLIPMKPFLRSVSSEEVSTSRRKEVIVAHVDETFLLVQLLFRNLDLLIWRDARFQESKVREFVLVPSFKLASLEQTEAGSIDEVNDEDDRTIRVDSYGLQRKDSDGLQRKNSNSLDVKGLPGEDKDLLTEGKELGEEKKSTNIAPIEGNGKSSIDGSVKTRRGGYSLDERRKRLRKLWLDL